MVPAQRTRTRASKEEVRALLVRAREIVRAGWTAEVYARDAGGREVEPVSPRARRFCAVGALIRADAELNLEPWERVAMPVCYEGSIVFVAALALLSAAAQITVVHPQERSSEPLDRVWARAALRSPARGLVDVVNDRGGKGRRGILDSYDLAVGLAEALPPAPISAKAFVLAPPA